jgi:hypothetical protein
MTAGTPARQSRPKQYDDSSEETQEVPQSSAAAEPLKVRAGQPGLPEPAGAVPGQLLTEETSQDHADDENQSVTDRIRDGLGILAAGFVEVRVGTPKSRSCLIIRLHQIGVDLIGHDAVDDDKLRRDSDGFNENDGQKERQS